MDKEEALHEFIKGLRIAFNNSLAYPRQHPYFIKSVEDFRVKIDTLFGFISPIKLNITPDSLFLDGRYWTKPFSYVELAQILHQRKIKAIELRQGLNTNELADLLSALALAPKDVAKNGGLSGILKKAETAHIGIEELDYSELLHMRSAGVDGDIWLYLFKGAIASKDLHKIDEVAGAFPEYLNNIDIKNLVSDEGLKQDLTNFFHYLKENNKPQFSDCSNAFFNYLIESRNALSQDEAKSLKSLFKSFNENDFSDILRTQVSKNETLDPLFLSFFSMFSQEAVSDKIASFLPQNTGINELLDKDPLAAKRIQAFLSNPDSQSVSPVYRNTLLSLLKGISYTDDFYFDPKELRVNYRFVLLNMLKEKQDAESIKLILSGLNKEWPFIAQDKDYAYIKHLLEVIKEKDLALLEEAGILKDKITVFLEEGLWEDNPNEDFRYLVGILERSSKGSQFYLDKIFREGKISVSGLELFLKFFPAELDIFYQELESKNNDLNYLNRVIKIIAGLGSNLPLAMLRHLYASSNEMIKAEILAGMQGLRQTDKGFLLDALKEKNKTLRKEALKALAGDSEAVRAGLEVILRAHSPLGTKNKLILENMLIVKELGLKEAAVYLAPFARMNFFWHAPLKREALSILEGLK